MNILAIGAHYDDIEIGVGGTLARLKAEGHATMGYVVTKSDYADFNGVEKRSEEVALAEGKAAADILGYELIAGHRATKEVLFDADLVEDINRIIVEREIDCLFTHWDCDVHQDHQAIGAASLAAARRLGRVLMYQSNLYFSSAQFRDDFFFDITDYSDVKFRSILAHKTEADKFGPEWLAFWKNKVHANGQRIGVQYAEAFQLIKYLL